MDTLLVAFPGNEILTSHLSYSLGVPNFSLQWRHFPDGESLVKVPELPKASQVILICTLNDPDSKTLPLLFAAHTFHELGAKTIGLIAPYLAYMRQDIRFQPGEAISSRLFAQHLCLAFDWLMTIDPHLHRHHQLSDIYSIPTNTLSSAPLLGSWIKENVRHPLLIGPDEESAQWIKVAADLIDAPYITLSKVRSGDKAVNITPPDLSSFQHHTPVLLDDIISSGRTLTVAANALRKQGLNAPVCVAVHALFSQDAEVHLIQNSIAEIATTNTIPHSTNKIDIAPLLATAVAQKIMN